MPNLKQLGSSGVTI